jgi:transposase
MAFELSWSKWKIAFTIGHGQKPRLRQIRARDVLTLHQEIAKAKKRFDLPPDAKVVSCYEAGRDGFWLHRHLLQQGIHNSVVDSSSIEVNRRQRRAKSDRLDAAKLLSMLLRYQAGDKKVWSVVQVPEAAAEDARQLHRELQDLKGERTGHVNRMKGLLAGQGVELEEVNGKFADWLAGVRLWDGQGVPAELQQRLLREYERWQLVGEQIRRLEQLRRERLRTGTSKQLDMVRKLLGLAGIGANGAWLLVYELFGWRRFRNRRQLAGITGLTGTPYDSGDSRREQGISKSGNRRLRHMLVELAWCWLRWQRDSALTRWFWERFGYGGKRLRKVGVVAVARKLLIALWRYLERGEVPQGARLVDWRTKVGGRALVDVA